MRPHRLTVLVLVLAGVAATYGGGLAAAQDATAPEYAAQAAFRGSVPPIYRNDQNLSVTCLEVNNQLSESCHAEGTYTIKVTAAAKRKLGISSATVGRGALVHCGTGVSCGWDMKVPADVKRKGLKAARQCSCEKGILVPGRITIVLTGPTGLPAETITGSGKFSIGGRVPSRSDYAYACTSNWSKGAQKFGSCDPGSGSGVEGR
jgi:hypothetical protein